MVQIFGRLAADATVKTVGEQQVVNFTIAINDWYKPKGKDEGVEQVTFVQCGYWFNTGIATSLKKGAFVEAGGRLFSTAYMKDDEPQGRINMQAQHVKVHVFAKKDEFQNEALPQAQLWETEQNGTTETKPGRQSKNKPKPNKRKDQQTPVEVGAVERGDDLPF